MARQGYAVLALGAQRYYEMAVTAALSLRLADPSRPVALLCDEGADEAHTRWFDEAVTVPPDPGLVGVGNKLRLAHLVPFERSMVIDADCVVVKPDMERHWDRYGNRAVGLAGEAKRQGSWYGFDVGAVLGELAIPYLVEGNTGVLTFDRTAGSEAVGETALRLIRERSDVFGLAPHQGRAGQLSDEPFWGAALGAHGIEPVGYASGEGTIMATSWRARRQEADLRRGESLVEKPTGFRVAGRLWAKGWVRHSPTVMHFIGLKPRALYARLSGEVREAAGAARDPCLEGV
jgi:hypothetical protein